MPNLGSSEQFTVVLIEIIICDAVLILLNSGVSSHDFCHAQILAHFLPDPSNSSALKLTMVTNEVAL